jgi:hypothetical protein
MNRYLFTKKFFQTVARWSSLSALLISLCMPLLGIVSVVSAEAGNDPTQSSFQLVPCDGYPRIPADSSKVIPGARYGTPCDYNQFIIGIQRIIKACILFAVPIAAGVFGWFGIKMMTSGGDVKSREEAKAAMFKVLKGMFLMLAAWYIVDLALSGLLDPNFKSGLQK